MYNRCAVSVSLLPLCLAAAQQSLLRIHNQRRHPILVAVRAVDCIDVARYQPNQRRNFSFGHNSVVSVGVFFDVSDGDQERIDRQIRRFDRYRAEGVSYDLCAMQFARERPDYIVSFYPEVRGIYDFSWKHSLFGPLYYCCIKRKLDRYESRLSGPSSFRSVRFSYSVWNCQENRWETDIERIIAASRAFFGSS